ncbi:MAG: GH3 auxin-responsive promoter family protein [Planctomycetes bacterium]|nr:GH3 auxin-responsive promoter family protein [Planctomycetota bacterium]
MTRLASFFIRLMGRAAARRFEEATRRPVEVQEQKLKEILARNQDTEYGREHGFAAVRCLADYRKAAPIVSYEDIKERMERVTRGAKNVFTAEDPVMFAKTSGTSGDAKYIPVTPTCQGRDHAGQMRTWFYHAISDHPRLFHGKALSLVSPAIEGYTPSGIPFGSTSGLIYKNMPAVVRGTYAVPYEVFEIQDYEAKYYVLMRLGLQMNVTFMATANPSSVVKMCELANEHADSLLADLARGTLCADLAVPAPIRAQVEALCRADPSLAARLEKARARRGGRLLPADYWPNLQLIGCWKGGTVGTYLQRFPAWFWPEEGGRVIPIRDWGYLSSEARGSIPLSDTGAGGVLTVGTNVYEFVPVEELEAAPEQPDSWTFLGADEIELGRDYYVFFTTTGGLYRYDINDVVGVVGMHHRTPVIAFKRKGRGATSITGEKVTVTQVIEAFQRAAAEAGVEIDHYKAEADVQRARYLFMAESSAGIPPEKRQPLLQALERSLARLNIEYEGKRKSLRLGPPQLLVMRPGWYDREKKSLIAQGKRLFQAKTIRLSDHRADLSDEVEAIVEWRQDAQQEAT